MALPSYQYRDPLEQLIAKENRTCKGCRYLLEVFDRKACGLVRKKLRKCGMYNEKENQK